MDFDRSPHGEFKEKQLNDENYGHFGPKTDSAENQSTNSIGQVPGDSADNESNIQVERTKRDLFVTLTMAAANKHKQT